MNTKKIVEKKASRKLSYGRENKRTHEARIMVKRYLESLRIPNDYKSQFGPKCSYCFHSPRHVCVSVCMRSYVNVIDGKSDEVFSSRISLEMLSRLTHSLACECAQFKIIQINVNVSHIFFTHDEFAGQQKIPSKCAFCEFNPQAELRILT